MTVIKALILGIVAGITDFLPVSASGHITLVSNILGIQAEIDLMFIIAVHLGTALSVLLVYYMPAYRCLCEFFSIVGDVITNTKELFTRRVGEKKYRRIVTNHYRKLVFMILIAMIPTIVIGILVTGLSETLIGNALGAGIGFFVTALLLLVASFAGRAYKGPHEAKYFDAFLVGAFQGFAGFPGISRLGMTASSSFLSGFTAKLTLLFSLMLSIPTVIGAFAFEAIRTKSAVSSVGIGFTVISMFTATLVGYFVLVLLKKLISQRFTRYFAIYCCIAGVVSVIVYLV